MIRTTARAIIRQRRGRICGGNSNPTQRCKSTATSSTGGSLQGDSGNVATHIHHKMTTLLAGVTPIYFFAPDDLISASVDKGIGMLLAINVAGHNVGPLTQSARENYALSKKCLKIADWGSVHYH